MPAPTQPAAPAPDPSPGSGDPRVLLHRWLGRPFRNPGLLTEALTHPSCLQTHPQGGPNNQRLEFLGDAVLQLVLSEELFRLFPAEREGMLSRRRAMLGNGPHLARLAREIGLDRCLRLGASEESSGGRGRDAALEDAFEAVVGAVHQDGGIEEARRFVLAVCGDLAARLGSLEGGANPKGRLQELVQPAHGNKAIRYDLAQASGPDHARAFEVEVFLNDRCLGRGRGPSKKLAEEAAARAALAALAADAAPAPPPGA